MLEVTQLSKSFGEGDRVTHAIADVSFTVNEGDFLCVVGPSGCGKTTLLRSIAGLLKPTSGQVVLNDRPVVEPPEQVGFVFQEYSRSLLPWMSVRDNIELPLRHKPLDKPERGKLVEEAVRSVGLSEFIDRYPWELSGGMQQRVAIARALAYQPAILLMDEPFASVDAQTRADLEDLVLRIRTAYGMTVLFVTHDIDEAVYLGSRVVVLTSPPTKVDQVLDVDLPEPRDQVETKELPEFTHLRTHLFRAIKREQTADTTG